MFDFAEKVLLPSLPKQPGQLHFVTGLKYDFFGVHRSNLGKKFAHSLPEGHWSQGKTANEVGYMLLNSLETHKADPQNGNCFLVTLHAYNCCSQNKNRFLLWLLSSRILLGLEDSISLNFLVAGHTKNWCDAAFGFVKRNLNTVNVLCPRDMMDAVDSSSASTVVIPCTNIQFMDWKSMLSQWITYPSAMAISKQHCFFFEKSSPGCVTVKELSTSTA